MLHLLGSNELLKSQSAGRQRHMNMQPIRYGKLPIRSKIVKQLI